jgi:FkbM family methyltransferase
VPAASQGPLDVGLLRACLRCWPFPRGKRLLLRYLRNRPGHYRLEVEPGISVPADFDDYVIWWMVSKMSGDAPFLLSLDLIRAGDIVVDVGANIGLWSLPAAGRVGPAGAVHAIEPAPVTFDRLISNIGFNTLEGRIFSHRFAFSDRDGIARLAISDNGNSGASAFVSDTQTSLWSTIDTRTLTLDGFHDQQESRRIDFLKVDVEGAESLVFRGGTATLGGDDAPLIFFEICDARSASFGTTSRDTKSLLARLGYRLYRFDGRSLLPVAADEEHPFEDVFGLKPRHIAEYPRLRELMAHA